jgi:hypothetical protein
MPITFGAGGLVGGGLKAGQLIHRMRVIGTVTVDLPNGGQGEAPGVIEANVPCTLQPLDATEKVRLGTQYAEATHQIRAHYSPRIRVEHQLEIDDPYLATVRTFDLILVTNVNERGRELNLLAVERVT